MTLDIQSTVPDGVESRTRVEEGVRVVVPQPPLRNSELVDHEGLPPASAASEDDELTPWEFLKHYTTVSTAAATLFLGLVAWLGLDRLAKVEATARETIRGEAAVLLEEAIGKRISALESRIGAFEQKSKETIQAVEARLEPFQHLAHRPEDLDELANLMTVGVAVRRIEQLLLQDKEDVAIRIAQQCVDPKKPVPGSSTDFHNLSAAMARLQQTNLALSIALRGLKEHTTNSDLLADAVKYSTDLGRYSEARSWYAELQKLDKSQWSWRCFDFAADYLNGTGQAEEALKVYHSFQMEIPNDERGYSGPGLYWMSLGRFDKAIESFEQGRNNCKSAPQCLAALAELYIATGEYEKAVAAADHAVQVNIGEQPTTNEAATIWRRAQALDAWVHQEIRSRVEEDPMWVLARDERDALIRRRLDQCLIDYETAMQMRDSLQEFHSQGSERVRILNALRKRYDDERALAPVSPLVTAPIEVAVDQDKALGALSRGDLVPFLEFMQADYFEQDVWLSRVIRLFPEFDIRDIATESEIDPLDERAVQDALAFWVLTQLSDLEWDENAGTYKLREPSGR